MSSLYLVGTVHTDLDSHDRLSRILQTIRPTVVGHEGTADDLLQELEESYYYRFIFSNERAAESYLQSLAERHAGINRDTVRLLLTNACGESRAIATYALSASVPVLHCEDSAAREPTMRVMMPELTNPESETIRDFICFIRQTPEEARAEIERDYKAYDPAVSEHLAALYTPRDAAIERRLRDYLHRYPDSVMVYEGGQDHLFADYHPNLADRLTDLDPVLISLHEADDIQKLRERIEQRGLP